MRLTRVRLGIATAFAFLVATPLASARAQDIECERGDLEVFQLNFEGNHAISDAELARAIVTTPSGFARRFLHLPFTTKHCLDRTEFPNDRARLIILYRRRGFPRVQVDTAVKLLAPGAVSVTFKINEGPPMILRSFAVRGLDSVPERGRLLRQLGSIHEGIRFDRLKLEAAADSLRERLHNSGYPRAVAENTFILNDSALSAWDTLAVSPGPRTTIGAIKISVTPLESGKPPQISARTVRKIMGLDSGELYRENEILDAQRAIYQTEAYQHVSITPDSAADSVVTLYVNLAEAAMHAARVGAGYGTLDCFRLTAEYTDYNFLSGARRLDLNARVSKIGIGRPMDWSPSLCPAAKKDVFSTRSNYYLGATLRQPVFLGLRTVPTLTLYTQRVSEYNAYLRTTAIGGAASVIWRGLTRTPVNLTYSMDLGRTEAQPALYCAVFNLCEAAERDRVKNTQQLAILSLAVTRDNSNSILSPTRGSIIRLEARHSSPAILSNKDLQFNKLVGDGSRYVGIGNSAVLAMRVRGGTVFGRNVESATGFIPPQERLYAGGPTTVRGFSQNELGSLIYISRNFEGFFIDRPDGTRDTVVRQQIDPTPDNPRPDTTAYSRIVPVGGNSLLVGNIELRLRSPFLPELLQWTLFTDAGEVWNRGTSQLKEVKLKVTPGIQLTAFSPVGPVRLAVGYNPYRRPPGPIYYEALNLGGELLCVSPRNEIKTHFFYEDPSDPTKITRITQDEDNPCPSNFQPPKDNRLRSKLTFSFAIGQAF
ncbi:MAG TPA: BamA/TamA family outer membrane protein [Gemmatimonadaceae bacterium]|nr:BamA/TamA family outer membrane protein [Gemmatimonadaceae bacterium]